jgi:hypothetical protein
MSSTGEESWWTVKGINLVRFQGEKAREMSVGRKLVRCQGKEN